MANHGRTAPSAQDRLDLTGSLLVAMPGMGDPRFDHAVIYMTAHTEQGAMGLIVNKPAPELTLGDVLEQLSDTDAAAAADVGVHFGGPVETGRGFVLHSDDYTSAIQTRRPGPGVALTATMDILEDIVAGRGPRRALLLLGYAGWGPGQLENEIAQNGWLTCAGSAELVFGLPDARKWAAALETIGIDPLGLSAAAGRA